MIPNRFVPLQQVFNLRDLGGLTTTDGRLVRTGLVYRSDQFGNACSQDIDHLVNERRIRSVIDFRAQAEIDATGSFPKHDTVTVHHLPFRHTPWFRFDRDVENEPSPVPFLVQRYTAMIETGADEVRAALELICDATPLIFHCMAGKDRTGITAAVTLKLLGVDNDAIAADYALTAQGMSRFRAWLEASEHPNLTHWGLAPEADVMYQLLDNIDMNFGSITGYAKAIGFTRIDDLHAHLLD